MKRLSLWLVFLAFATVVRADLIPPANIVPWTPGTYTGVTGGIPSRPSGGGTTINVTASPYFADNTGATDASSAIQSAINASTGGSVIYLPTGTYRCDNTLSILQSASLVNRVLRGDGPALTIIDSRNAVAVSLGASDNINPPFGNSLADATVSGGLTVGSTQITVGSSSGYADGALLVLNGQSSTTVPMGATYQQNYSMMQIRKVTGRPSGTTVSFSPPLVSDMGGGALTVYAFTGENGSQAYNYGIESLTINMSNFPGVCSAIFGQQMRDSWIKDVKITGVTNYAINLIACTNFEIRHCYLDELRSGGSNRAGLLSIGCSGILFEDNIIYNVQPAIEINSGSSGNFFSKNFAIGAAFGFDTNHGPGCTLNLYEGNLLNEAICDGTFGGATYDTFYRNYIFGTLSLKRMTRNYATAGNFIGQQIQTGYPNIGNLSYSGNADYPTVPGLDWGTGYGFDATLTTRTGDNTGTITVTGGSVGSIVAGRMIQASWDGGFRVQKYLGVIGVVGTVLTVGIPPFSISVGPAFPTAGTALTISAGVEGFQEMDDGVARTLSKKGNRYIDTNSFDSLGGDTLVDSLVYGSTKPQWLLDDEAESGRTFALATWDPVTPATYASNQAAAELIPAGYRYYNPDGSTSVANVTNLNVGTIRLAP